MLTKETGENGESLIGGYSNKAFSAELTFGLISLGMDLSFVELPL